MTEHESTTGAVARSYRPGSWFAVFGTGASVLLPPSEKRRVAALWALVDDGAGFDEVLDALITSGLRDLPGFVLLGHEGTTVRVVVRGGASVTFTLPDDEVEVSGLAASTWVERTLTDVTSHAVVLEGADDTDLADDAADLPIASGLVRVARVDTPARTAPRPVPAEALADGGAAAAPPAAAAPAPAPVISPVEVPAAADPLGVDTVPEPELPSGPASDPEPEPASDSEPEPASEPVAAAVEERPDDLPGDVPDEELAELAAEVEGDGEEEAEGQDGAADQAPAAPLDLVKARPAPAPAPDEAPAADEATMPPMPPLPPRAPVPPASPFPAGGFDDAHDTGVPAGDDPLGDAYPSAPPPPPPLGDFAEPAPSPEQAPPPPPPPFGQDQGSFADDDRAAEPATEAMPLAEDVPPPPPPAWAPGGGYAPPPPPPAPSEGFAAPAWAGPAGPAGDSDVDHDGMTQAGGWDPAQFSRPSHGIPGQPPAPSVTSRPVAKLVISSGDTVDVDRAILVGRAPEARRFSSTEQPRLVTVPSPQQEISSTHLEVRPGSGVDHGSAVVTDMGSTNGTVLMQPGLPPEELQPGIAVQLIPGAVIDLGDGVTIQVANP
ncbi:FHA domain-containing protein [Nocardioides sp. CPCC 205120]|uniref:FHA domain-containing protein n=1 Tax=Nocardioides sp. CPCC 205120 TaxID=3406462 RepID=UPI003B50F701